MLNKVQQKIYNKYLELHPFRYIIAEPPRGNTIRLYNRTFVPPFVLIGDNKDQEWRSIAKVLDLDKHYYEKTPLSEECLWVDGLHLYLVRPEDNKYYESKGFTYSGPALFEEDEHNPEVIMAARERYVNSLDQFIRDYEEQMILTLAGMDKPKRKPGRPKGSRNKSKEVSNG